jgi:replication factor C large subunit
MSWTEKYRPNKFFEIKGQEEAVYKVKNFLQSFGKNARGKKAILLHGPPGTGKTTLAHVAAKENGFEIFELNASDFRNKTKLQDSLKPAIEQKSLFKDKKLILIDEVDGITTVDWGGLSEIIQLINSTSYPIIITGNSIWDRKFNTLREKTEIVQLKEINYKTIKEILIDILRKENKFINNEFLTGIAIKAKGDLRAAINDIQTESGINETEISEVGERNKETDIFNALRLVFKGKPTEETIRVFDSVDMPIDEILLWVEENVPAEYKNRELAKAIDLISKTDIFKRRIYRQQYWRFLIYENFFLSFGVSASKEETKTGFTSYKKPSRILKIWLNNRKNEKKKTIAQKYAHYTHIGEKRALHEFPVIKYILKNPETRKELRLTEDEIEWLDKG